MACWNLRSIERMCECNSSRRMPWYLHGARRPCSQISCTFQCRVMHSPGIVTPMKMIGLGLEDHLWEGVKPKQAIGILGPDSEAIYDLCSRLSGTTTDAC